MNTKPMLKENEIPMSHKMQEDTLYLINVLSYYALNRVMHPDMLTALTHYTQNVSDPLALARLTASIKEAEKEDTENKQ